MTLTNYQVPMWSVILGILVLGEPFHASLFVALGFILCGVCLSQYGALKRLFGRK
jgi:drug/metabolite transporter (DMT)-like permease